MSVRVDSELVARRGGNVCGADRFSVEACGHCHGHYLFNAELNDVYFDPEDLGRRYFRLECISLPPCRYCGALQWDFAAEPPAQNEVQSGPWRWVLKSREFTFSEGDGGPDRAV